MSKTSVARYLCFASWVLICVFAAQGDSFQEEKKKKKKEVDPDKRNPAWYKFVGSKAGVRSNGAQLQATVAVEALSSGDEIHIDWSLDYTGARQPLIILQPSLEKKTAGQTSVVFYWEGKDRKIHEHRMNSPEPIIFGGGDHVFMTVEKGKKGSGRITVPATLILNHFHSRVPEQFEPKAVPILHLRMVHEPHERGGDIDAWTGKLGTLVLQVPLTKK